MYQRMECTPETLLFTHSEEVPGVTAASETERLAALHQYAVLDTPPEQAFDDFARLAAALCNAPISIISLMDDTRHWFKSKVGTEMEEMAHETAFCTHTIQQADVMVIPDALQDSRFAANPLVTGDPNIRFYAGVSLINAAGHALGNLCVVDTVPRDLSGEQTEALRMLSRQIVALLEQRRAQADLRLLESAVQQCREAIMITTADLELPGPRIVTVNPAFTRITGYQPADLAGKTPRILQGPRTERAVLDSLRRSLSKGEPFAGETVNYRKDGTAFWMEWEVAPLSNAQGEITHFVATQRDVTHRHESQQSLQRHFERITALRAIDASIIHNRDIRLTLGLVLDQVRALLDVDAAAALLVNSETRSLEYAVCRGFRHRCTPLEHERRDSHPATRAALEGRSMTLLDMPDEGAALLRHLDACGESFLDYEAIPIVANGETRGVLELFYRQVRAPDAEWQECLQSLIGQAAIAINNSIMFEALQRANQELVTSHEATINGWSQVLDLRDKETEGHSQRVTNLTLRLAERMNVSGEDQVQMRRGALLHDIGKMGVPDSILLKPGLLTDPEWAIMRRHPEHAYELLYPIAFLRPALAIPLCHHERWDGTGYPHGMKAEQIPLAARIFAVADVWDALRSDRPYRRGWPAEKVREHIRSLSGIHFDPAVVEAFLNLEDV